MIKLYGTPASRASRPMWALEELGLPYEVVRVDIRKGDHKNAEFLSVNPCGKVPALVDGDVCMSESLAMNLYIAQRYGMGKLWPTGDDAHARIIQWTLWAANELEPVSYGMLREVAMTKPEERKADVIAALGERAKPLLQVLTVYLERHQNLIGDAFTLADLQVACVLDYCIRGEFSLAPWPKVAAWHAACQARPAYKKVQDLRAAFVQANP
jgi:glutathione S-transferase